jgi:hypothetical protein
MLRIILILIMVTACTPDFDSPSDVFDLRVLAVQAEPPEAQFDKSGVDQVEVHVLAVDPAARDLATMTAALCAPTDSKRCGSGPQLPLPTQKHRAGDEFRWTVSLPKAVIEFAQNNDDLKGLGGIRVMLSIAVDDGDPHGPVYASKTLLYSPRGKPPNHNPLMTGVQLTRDGKDAGKLNPGDALALTPGVQIGLRPLLDPNAREEYDTTDLRGNTVHLKEDPVYSFFTTPGAELDRDGADEPLDGVAPPDGLARIQARSGGGSGTLWIVVRDGRGGESWLAFSWTTAR